MSRRKEAVHYHTNSQGYEVWTESITNSTIGIHRLVAIANGADPYKVFDGKEYDVHHKNGLEWDNRPVNLQLLTKSEHMRIHAEQKCELNEKFMEEKVLEEGLDAGEIADQYDFNKQYVRSKMKKYELRWDLRWKR